MRANMSVNVPSGHTVEQYILPARSVTESHSTIHPAAPARTRCMNCKSMRILPTDDGNSPTIVAVSTIMQNIDTATRASFNRRYICSSKLTKKKPATQFLTYVQLYYFLNIFISSIPAQVVRYPFCGE